MSVRGSADHISMCSGVLDDRRRSRQNSRSAFASAFAPGAKTWSFTVTPTYQYKQYFIRAEASYVTASHIDPYAYYLGTAYGGGGDKKDQIKGLIETGVAF